MRGIGERELHLGNADDDAADDVDEGDQEAGDGIAAHEFGGTVHGAEEGRFVFQVAAALARLALVDEAGRQVRVDRHLLAGHGIEGEARGDFGDTARALGDDDEIDDHQNGKDDEADDEIAPHDEIAERLDDAAGGIRALMAIGQDQPRRGKVQRQPQHGRDQQNGRKGGEFQRRLDEQRRHQDQHGKDDRDGEENIQHEGRHRQDQHDEDRDDAEGQRDIAPAQHRDHGRQATAQAAATKTQTAHRAAGSRRHRSVACRRRHARCGRVAHGGIRLLESRARARGSVGRICRVYGYRMVNTGPANRMRDHQRQRQIAPIAP